MSNLLQETKEAIASSGHTESDIVFIGSESSWHQCTWAEFCALADVEYDAGFGASHVAQDLIVVFGDGQKLWRDERQRKWLAPCGMRGKLWELKA
jgi:hypothetical protein